MDLFMLDEDSTGRVAKKTYCKECHHLHHEKCHAPCVADMEDDWYERYTKYPNAYDINRNNDCKHYKRADHPNALNCYPRERP